MKRIQIAYVAIVLLVILVVVPSRSMALTPRCQVGNVSYKIPPQAAPAQRIQTATTVYGSCVTTGEDYYSIRVDLVDASSSSILSSNSTPIGYNATNFLVTVENTVTTPSNNGTWHFKVDVYVIRAGGTGGFFLLDYRSTANATIQVGTIPVPEFPQTAAFTLTVAVLAVALLRRRRHA